MSDDATVFQECVLPYLDREGQDRQIVADSVIEWDAKVSAELAKGEIATMYPAYWRKKKTERTNS